MSTKTKIARAMLFWTYDMFELAMLGLVVTCIGEIAYHFTHMQMG